MQNELQTFTDLLIRDFKKRLFEEGIPRIKKCLKFLDEGEIWYRPNDQLVSVGNLILHLCGNVRQWILSGLFGEKDTRIRELEFNETGPIPREDLIKMLDHLQREVEDVLVTIDPSDLIRRRKVQGIFDESGISILLHVSEHFSYHVGQITYYVKWKKEIDTAYFSGLKLDGNSSGNS